MKVILFSFLLVLLSSAGFANTYVKCGESVDFDTYEVDGFELELSSEDPDGYNGPVGLTWNLKLESEDSEWLAPSRKVIAKSYKSGSDTVIDITITMDQSVSGPVGTEYKLIGLYRDEPVLEKYTMGGFAGTQKLGTYQCISSNI